MERTIEWNEPTEALTDEELSLVPGGGIGSFLTQLGQDIKNMLSNGGGRGGGSGMAGSVS